MADSVFNNVNSMTAAQIDSWINTNFPNSCISTNNGFSAPDPNGYSPSAGFTFGGAVSAGQVIYDAAHAYGTNPEVLLATLQKEEGLVRGDGPYGCSALAISASVGYGCPDSGSSYSYNNLNPALYYTNGTPVTAVNNTCVNSAAKAGFAQQLIRASWLLEFGQQRSRGNVNWEVIKPGWDNSDDPITCYGGPMTQGTFKRCSSDSTAVDYDGYTTIDGQSTHMDTGATAALYWYTPHFSGNQSFDTIFDNWFGSTQTTTPYAWLLQSKTAYTDSNRTSPYTDDTISIVPSGKAYIKVQAQNNGNQTWPQSVVKLGTSNPQDRASVFTDSTWLNASRIQMQETSVSPGDSATFLFSLTAPATAGSYKECFNLLAENITWMNDPGLCFNIDVVATQSPYNLTNTGLDPGKSINANQFLQSSDAHTVFIPQGDGNVVLYSDFSPKWWSSSFSKNASKLIMQTDGNLVLYSSTGTPLWNTQTGGNPGARFVLQTDGNAVVYSSSDTALWAASFSEPSVVHNPGYLNTVNHSLQNALLYPGQRLRTAAGNYYLVLQTDGNLVLYSSTRALWATGTDGKQTAFLAMQGDGNLVLYDTNHKPLWYSGTAGVGPSKLVMQDDGNLVVYTNSGKPTWNTQTNGKS